MQTFIRCCLLLAITATLVSVFLSGVFLGLAFLAWVYQGFAKPAAPIRWPGYFPFVLAFMLAALLAMIVSEDMLESAHYVRKFVHFFAILLVFNYFDRRWVKLTTWGVFVAAAVSGCIGTYQYFVLRKVELLDRVTGFMSHWMTFGGQMMIVSIMLAAFLVSLFPPWGSLRAAWARANRHVWLWAALLPLLLFVLVLSMTRSAWVGAGLGLLLIGAVRTYRLALVGILLIVVAWAVLPERLSERVKSSFDPADTTNRVRVELWRTGLNVVRSHPYMGIGPRMVPRTFRHYRVSNEFPDWAYQHLHNNAVQVAAEMGLLGLAAWFSIWLKLAWDHVRFLRKARQAEDRQLFATSIGALASLLAFLAAGLFEYNFGDSEILFLLLFVVTAPYICAYEKTTKTSTTSRTE